MLHPDYLNKCMTSSRDGPWGGCVGGRGKGIVIGG